MLRESEFWTVTFEGRVEEVRREEREVVWVKAELEEGV